MPSSGPRSQCALGSKSNRGGWPTRRISALATIRPHRHGFVRDIGNARQQLRNSSSSAFPCSSRPAISSFIDRTCSWRAPVSWPCRRSLPISALSAFTRASVARFERWRRGGDGRVRGTVQAGDGAASGERATLSKLFRKNERSCISLMLSHGRSGYSSSSSAFTGSSPRRRKSAGSPDTPHIPRRLFGQLSGYGYDRSGLHRTTDRLELF